MAKNSYFQFKEFTINQKESAMKVGVDSVILGAWANMKGAGTILDVGAGTGLIALMMAQRTAAHITAVEIDEPSYHEAAANIASSGWGGRITLIHGSFQKFADTSGKKFDVIISNPPYFENSSRPGDPRRKNARHNDELPFTDFIVASLKILDAKGQISVILPVESAARFERLAADAGLFLKRTTWIKHHPGKAYHRRMMEFTAYQCKSEESVLIIEQHGQFTKEYRELTGAFYLAF
jgi:tRNA1Val (adenine37-N6)-methyltransferase